MQGVGASTVGGRADVTPAPLECVASRSVWWRYDAGKVRGSVASSLFLDHFLLLGVETGFCK